MRLLVGALALCAPLTVLLGVGNAMAARGLMTGFADSLFESSNPGERALWLDRSVESGAGLVRLNVVWRAVAPTPPPDPDNAGSLSYDFGAIDAAVRDARARGLTVMLTVSGAPDWAEGPGRPSTAVPGTWKPDPSSLASFMRAVAQRYSGGFDPDGPGSVPAIPAVQAVEVWNEPNLLEYLAPQYEGSTPVSPDYYRKMLNASYAAVKSVDPAMLVVTGGTAPYGGPSARGVRLRPVAFDRRLLCLRKVRPKHAKPSKKKKAQAQKTFWETRARSGLRPPGELRHPRPPSDQHLGRPSAARAQPGRRFERRCRPDQPSAQGRREGPDRIPGQAPSLGDGDLVG